MAELRSLSYFKRGIWGLKERVRSLIPLGTSTRPFSILSWTPPLQGGQVFLSCLDSFPVNKYLLSKYYVPGTVWGTRNALVSKGDTTVPFLDSLYWQAFNRIPMETETSLQENHEVNTQGLNYILRGGHDTDSTLLISTKKVSKQKVRHTWSIIPTETQFGSSQTNMLPMHQKTLASRRDVHLTQFLFSIALSFFPSRV